MSNEFLRCDSLEIAPLSILHPIALNISCSAVKGLIITLATMLWEWMARKLKIGLPTFSLWANAVLLTRSPHSHPFKSIILFDSPLQIVMPSLNQSNNRPPPLPQSRATIFLIFSSLPVYFSTFSYIPMNSPFSVRSSRACTLSSIHQAQFCDITTFISESTLRSRMDRN